MVKILVRGSSGEASVEVEGDNVSDVRSVLAQLGVSLDAPLQTPVVEKVAEPAAAADKPAKGKKRPAAPKAAPAPAEKPEDDAGFPEDDLDAKGTDDATEAVEEKPRPTVEQLRDALMNHMKTHGEPAVAKILKDVAGADKLSQVKVADYQAVLDACDVE